MSKFTTTQWGNQKSQLFVLHVWGTFAAFHGHLGLVWCTWDILEMRFSKRHFYICDSFSTTLFIGLLCDTPQESDFLQFRNLNFKKKKKWKKNFFNIVA